MLANVNFWEINVKGKALSNGMPCKYVISTGLAVVYLLF
jgi:hypothetical protein